MNEHLTDKKWAEETSVPGSILSAAVDVGPVLHQVAHDPQPAAGAGLVQGAVPGVVSMVHIADPPLEAVQHHLLDRTRRIGTANETTESFVRNFFSCYVAFRFLCSFNYVHPPEL